MSQPPPAQPIATAPIATVPLKTRGKTRRESNVKETIEQILVAFILAFIFRCFIVEAFVIPTGSMATTLLGAHVDYRCPDCGWDWNVNFSSEDGSENIPARARDVVNPRCPNCGYKIARNNPAEPDNQASRPPVQYGDRILVQKYLYLAHEPRRWDVVVFKNPDSARDEDPYAQNYIKRLTGLPGETLMVLDGDIYVSSSTKPVESLTPDDFVVQTKTHQAQEALWRIVYDNDHLPRGLPRVYALEDPDPYITTPRTLSDPPWRQPWTPSGVGWDVSGGRLFRFDAMNGVGRLDFDRAAMPQTRPLTDWLGYDVTYLLGQNRAGYPAIRPTDIYAQDRYDLLNPVSDVKLALTYQRIGGTGPLSLRLTKGDHTFTARLDPDAVALLMTRPGETAPVEIGKASIGGGRHRVEFINADYRVSVRIDGKELLATTPAQFHPDIAALLADYKARQPREPATVSIEATDQQCDITHLSLWRDVYYLNQKHQPGLPPIDWASPEDFPRGRGASKLVRLGPDEYFTMGDNSMMSSDARYWLTPIRLPHERLDVQSGRVPGRFLLGKAFFVYWPAGEAPVSGLPGFVPNFGEMRFIH